MGPSRERLVIGIELFLIQALYFNTLWNFYYFERHSYWVFAGVFLTVSLLIFSIIRHWEGRAVWGIRIDNLPVSLKKTLIPLLTVVSVSAAVAVIFGVPFKIPKLSRFFEFPLAGLLQQILFQGYFFNRYHAFFKSRATAIFFTALTFSLFHLPNLPLSVITFGLGLYASFFFSAHRNIFAVALLHGWLSLALTFTLEPAGIIKDYKVGPRPMRLMIAEIQGHLTEETRIGKVVPQRGIASSFSFAFDRDVWLMDAPDQLDRYFAGEGLALVAIDKSKYAEIKPELSVASFVWSEHRVWLRKFPKQTQKTIGSLFTLNFKLLDQLYREYVLLISNRPLPAVA